MDPNENPQIPPLDVFFASRTGVWDDFLAAETENKTLSPGLGVWKAGNQEERGLETSPSIGVLLGATNGRGR